MLKIKLLILIILLGAAAFLVHHEQVKNNLDKAANTINNAASQAQSAEANAQNVVAKINHCASNKLAQNIIVDISQQHLWACEGPLSKYDSPVITGMESYPADLTPVGTYKIYGKQTDQTLRGSDSTGSWNDPVSYWEPFLSNKYGVYGFHDATWRANSDFGKIDINAPFTTTNKSASHGCVELPLATAKWLYNWSVVGTTVTIQS